ncbi:tetratricopeptide repeat protein [Alteromonas sp. ASW11-130]|uniref:tetratricopeptide repeat protein n=1 Tax=Alteromonas sp. ASW11-130 TaxID=3015775 RepID=UPI002241F07B|nr:hypothetical protein [Alteromonas sp. ASW11-130]MCW8092889.1 hypothetical protein [Alteromonas sp. ASW11-130]
MKKLTFNTPIAALMLGVSAISFSHTAVAQKSNAPVVCPGYEKGTTQLVGERTGKKVQRAFEAYNEDRVDEALQILMDIESSDEFDKAYVNRFVGNLLAAREGEGNRALNRLTSAVEPKVLNDLEHAQTLKLIGDLSMQEEKYSEAIKWYNKWMDFTCKEDPDVYTRLAQAYYEAKQIAKIIEPADKAIALYDEPNKNPYVLKMTSFYERKMYPETVKVAEELVSLFPEEPKWWTQLGLFYILIEEYKKSLGIFEIAYNNGWLTKENQIKQLAQLYASNGIPYKAARLMEKHLKEGLVEDSATNLAAVANSFHQAKNYDTAANFYGKAAAKSSDPDHYKKQGTLLIVAEDYKNAVVALENALERGAKDVGKIHFSLMEAHFYLGNFKKAYEYAEMAKKDSSIRRNANAWVPYIKEKAKNRGITI